MAKTVAPLLSFSASGQIAQTQVYSSWKGRPYVRRYVVPGNPNTVAQQETRNTFDFLNKVWPFFPAAAVGGWAAYADASRFTSRNGWIKQNLSNLRDQTDLTNIVLGVAARGGFPATALTVTPGSGQLECALTAPSLPSGWTITQAIAVAIAQQDPQSGTAFDVYSATDNSDPYAPIITGLTPSETYVVGAWFEFSRPDGLAAYGRSLQDTGVPTA
ncbi:MAG: hypothetical protein ACF8MF_06910 [Phycisphaerales bacterium JB052]